MKLLQAFLVLLSIYSLTACDSKTNDIADNVSSEPIEPKAVESASTAPLPSLRNLDLRFTPAKQHKTVQLGTNSVEFVFNATNQGLKPINITRVDSGCECIKESVEPKLIPPGGNAKITAVYDTLKLSGVAEKIMTIYSDQPGAGPASLIVKVEALPIYSIEPKMTSWRKGDIASRKSVLFKVSRDQPIKVLKAVSSRPDFKAEIEEINPGKIYKIHLTPDSVDKNKLGAIRLETDCEIKAHSRPLIYISVK